MVAAGDSHAEIRPAAMMLSALLDNVGSSRALGAVDHVKAYALPFLERFETNGLDG